MTDTIDCVVIGAGIVGLAVARALAARGREVVVLESAEGIGTGTSSRNSEVIHAGLYYATGSLKARLCVAGNRMMVDYCRARGIPHNVVGKLIVATDESEIQTLRTLLDKGRANNVTLHWLDGAQAREMEPGLICLAAIHSPTTGIVDSHQFMLSLQADAEADGAVFSFHSPVLGGAATGDGVLLRVGGAEPTEILCRTVVNCAGLGAQGIGAAIEGVRPGSVPPLHYCKGNYFWLSGKAPFTQLIYPVPGNASLGLHYTRDLGGQGRFGPDVEWVDSIDYKVDEARAATFYEAIRRYWPELRDGALQPGYAGVRPKLQAPGEPARDFVVQTVAEHDVPGLIALYGIESPGLTSSMALAELVADLAG